MIGFFIALLSGALMSLQGSIQYGGDETEQRMGVRHMGAVQRASGVSGDLGNV